MLTDGHSPEALAAAERILAKEGWRTSPEDRAAITANAQRRTALDADCRANRVDWRSRCLDAEVVVAAAEAWRDAIEWGTGGDLVAAIDAYRARGK